MKTIKIDGIEFNLTDLEKDCWVRLLNGSLKGKNAFHNATIANTNEHGVNIRTVVLRKVNTTEKTIAFHTDIRSGKWKEISENNKISWLFYDVAGRFQIRLAGNATLHHSDAVANDAWVKTNENSRKIYMGEIAPSLESEQPTSGLPTAFETENPTMEESEIGRKNFGVIITKVNWMEWLWLNSQGHKRASFLYDSINNFVGNWLVP